MRSFLLLPVLFSVACVANIHGEASSASDRECAPIEGNDGVVRLQPGVYHCDLVISGNDNAVEGAGARATTIDGRVIVTGNDNRLSGVRVLGVTSVSGNSNALDANEYAGGVEVSGNNNSR